MRLSATIILIFSISITSVFAKKNPYMVKGTEEYKNVTEKVIGNWEITSYVRNDRGEQISDIYKKATLELLFDNNKRNNVVWKFYLSDSVVQARSTDDREKDSTLKIDNYILIFNGKWDIYDKEPNLFRFTMDDNPEIEIMGSGNTIKDFESGQNALLGGTNALKNISGPAGFIASKAAKSKTGFNDIIAQFPYKAEFAIEGNDIDLKGNSNLLFKAKR